MQLTDNRPLVVPDPAGDQPMVVLQDDCPFSLGSPRVTGHVIGQKAQLSRAKIGLALRNRLKLYRESPIAPIATGEGDPCLGRISDAKRNQLHHYRTYIQQAESMRVILLSRL